MLARSINLAVAATALGVWLGQFTDAAAQEARPKSAPRQAPATGGGQPPAKAAPAANDAAPKAEILNSPQWRRAMFEFKEWLSAQQLYDAKQVEQIKVQFNEHVARMSATELAYLLADMQAKFQILESPQAQDARAWMAQYLSVMSDKKRAEVLKKVPNFATMTAAQLQREIMKIEQKRTTLEQEQAEFQNTQQQLAARQLQQDQLAQQTYIRERDRFPTSANSPYRSPSDVNARLNNAPIGTGMGFSIGPWGGVGISFSPSSW